MQKIKNKIKSIILCILHFFNELRYPKLRPEEYSKTNIKKIFKNDIKFKEIEKIELKNKVNKYKWVGAVNYNNYMYCIPNESNCILKVNMNNDEISYINFTSDEEGRKWTGGGIYKDKIYGFTRSANKLICISPKENDKVTFIDLKLNYKKEHHYGGVLTDDGFIIQPPRNNNTLLIIDLNNYTSREIKFSPNFLKYNYINGIMHSNGLIYFFPANRGRIMVYNKKNDKIFFIGKNVRPETYNCIETLSGNICGFSGYKNIIMKFDLRKYKYKFIQLQPISGSYGTKFGINGKIYNIPGVGDKFYEFDDENEQIREIYEIKNETADAKCAGGVMANDGTIYTVPAFGNTIYKIVFNKKISLSKEELKTLNDNY